MTLAATPATLPARLWVLGERALAALSALQPAAQLLARLYVGAVFFRSGLTKLRDWDTTIALFTDEYHVPLVDPAVAALAGTGGLAGRFAAAGLTVVNVVAVLSLAEIPDAALQGHVFWGSLLAALVLWGPGRWSADTFAVPWLRTRLLGPAPAQRSDYTAARPSTR